MLVNFYSDEAVQYQSIEIAIIIQKLRELVRQNQAFSRHYLHGVYWVKATDETLGALFPFIEKGKLFRCIYRMKDQGLIQYKRDQSNTHWLTTDGVNQIVNSPQVLTQKLPEQSGYQAMPEQISRNWGEIDEGLINTAIDKLIARHGYDQQHFIEIWHTFVSSMDANGERPPARFDIVEKRFIAYANKVQMNMSHANRRYLHTTKEKQVAKQASIDEWLKYVDNPPEQIQNTIDANGLNASLILVWNSFIAACYEKQVPLKNMFQLEFGFQKYVNSWMKNEQKHSHNKAQKRQVNLDDTSWASDIDLEGL